MKISVVGGGYVGIITGACLADLGNSVTVIDTDKEKVDAINSGQPPIYEPGLRELLQRQTGKKLFADTAFSSVGTADIVFLCVGTPPKPDGGADLSFVNSACMSIGMELKEKIAYCCVAVKSTVPPGTTDNTVKPVITRVSERPEKDIGFVMNPEFLREGCAIADFLHPDRIVIGSTDTRAAEMISSVYREITAPVLFTKPAAAEMIKYTSNAFLATKISFSNEIGNICKHLDIDVYEVMQGIGYDRRIGPLYLNAGAGFGGSCIPKDVAALVSLSKELNENPVLLEAVLKINEEQPHRMVSLLKEELGDLTGKCITVLGLAFKSNTDDVRDSRAIPVIRELLNEGARVSAYDPMAMSNMRSVFPEIDYYPSAALALAGSEGCLIMTEWPEFSQLDKEFDLMARRIIIEGRRILRCKGTAGVCW